MGRRGDPHPTLFPRLGDPVLHPTAFGGSRALVPAIVGHVLDGDAGAPPSPPPPPHRLRRGAIRGHLLRWRPRPGAQRRETTPRARPSGAASHMTPSRPSAPPCRQRPSGMRAPPPLRLGAHAARAALAA